MDVFTFFYSAYSRRSGKILDLHEMPFNVVFHTTSAALRLDMWLWCEKFAHVLSHVVDCNRKLKSIIQHYLARGQ